MREKGKKVGKARELKASPINFIDEVIDLTSA